MIAAVREDEQEFGAPLAASDSAALVDDAVDNYSQVEHEASDEAARSGANVEEEAVPTEFLQEDAMATMELPPTLREPSLVARAVARQPHLILALWVAVALLSTLTILDTRSTNVDPRHKIYKRRSCVDECRSCVDTDWMKVWSVRLDESVQSMFLFRERDMIWKKLRSRVESLG